MRKINALLFECSVDCFENQPAKVPCIYFIIYCYCAEVAVKSSGIQSSCVFNCWVLCMDRGHLCPIRSFPRERGRGIHYRDCVLFTLLLNQKYQPVLHCRSKPDNPHSCWKAKEVLFKDLQRCKIHKISSLSVSVIHILRTTETMCIS